MTVDLIMLNKIPDPLHLTNALWVLAKSKFKTTSNAYIDSAIMQLTKDPELKVVLACRNLWNLYALNHRSEHGLKIFSEIILRDSKFLNEMDIANSVRAFAHFQYMNYDCLEVLLKLSIRTGNDMKFHSLGVILNSFAELDITNPTLLNITKEIILAGSD